MMPVRKVTLIGDGFIDVIDDGSNITTAAFIVVLIASQSIPSERHDNHEWREGYNTSFYGR